MKDIKLTEYAKLMKIHYQTAFKWWKAGKIENAYKTPSGSVYVKLEEKSSK